MSPSCHLLDSRHPRSAALVSSRASRVSSALLTTKPIISNRRPAMPSPSRHLHSQHRMCQWSPHLCRPYRPYTRSPHSLFLHLLRHLIALVYPTLPPFAPPQTMPSQPSVRSDGSDPLSSSQLFKPVFASHGHADTIPCRCRQQRCRFRAAIPSSIPRLAAEPGQRLGNRCAATSAAHPSYQRHAAATDVRARPPLLLSPFVFPAASAPGRACQSVRSISSRLSLSIRGCCSTHRPRCPSSARRQPFVPLGLYPRAACQPHGLRRRPAAHGVRLAPAARRPAMTICATLLVVLLHRPHSPRSFATSSAAAGSLSNPSSACLSALRTPVCCTLSIHRPNVYRRPPSAYRRQQLPPSARTAASLRQQSGVHR